MSLIFRCLLLLTIAHILVDAVSMADKSSYNQLFRAVAKTYQYDPIFAAKDYESYVNTSDLTLRAPPDLVHQFGFKSPRHRHTLQNRASSSVHAIADESATSELLVSGPALAFIVVLTLGAFMF
ncbi:hypothetical protein BJV82DRAFT_639843 [Fennellomyces sp. T-0311]|nr:hypothetical protein BJV82DRAFT_639843 [Fennellomyces sp. T-0311]